MSWWVIVHYECFGMLQYIMFMVCYYMPCYTVILWYVICKSIISSYVSMICGCIPLHVSTCYCIKQCVLAQHIFFCITLWYIMVYYAVIMCYVMEGLSTDYHYLQWHDVAYSACCHMPYYVMLYVVVCYIVMGCNGVLLYFISLYIMLCWHMLFCFNLWYDTSCYFIYYMLFHGMLSYLVVSFHTLWAVVLWHVTICKSYAMTCLWHVIPWYGISQCDICPDTWS